MSENVVPMRPKQSYQHRGVEFTITHRTAVNDFKASGTVSFDTEVPFTTKGNTLNKAIAEAVRRIDTILDSRSKP